MIEIVLWSCVLGFSPIALCVGSKIVAIVMGLSCWTAVSPPASFPGDRLATDFGPHWIQRAGGFGNGR